MQLTISVRIALDEAEYFTAIETTLKDRRQSIQTQRITKVRADAQTYYCHGPKLLKNGKPGERNGCVLLEARELPATLLARIEAGLAPYLAVDGADAVGSEAARQAALG